MIQRPLILLAGISPAAAHWRAVSLDTPSALAASGKVMNGFIGSTLLALVIKIGVNPGEKVMTFWLCRWFALDPLP
jgi:hypothetical protein